MATTTMEKPTAKQMAAQMAEAPQGLSRATPEQEAEKEKIRAETAEYKKQVAEAQQVRDGLRAQIAAAKEADQQRVAVDTDAQFKDRIANLERSGEYEKALRLIRARQSNERAAATTAWKSHAVRDAVQRTAAAIPGVAPECARDIATLLANDFSLGDNDSLTVKGRPGESAAQRIANELSRRGWIKGQGAGQHGIVPDRERFAKLMADAETGDHDAETQLRAWQQTDRAGYMAAEAAHFRRLGRQSSR
ncbi:MAG: hypothetical protein ABSE73_12785 [Planctomycetota bacterium]